MSWPNTSSCPASAHDLDTIKARIRCLNASEAVYDRIDLTSDEQFRRGKPKPYIEQTIALLNAINGKTIVEIGCMRSELRHPITELHPSCCNDGHSTYFWALTGLRVFSVDIDRSAVRRARSHCHKFSNCSIYCQDGIEFLKYFRGSIDLLFLDAWDVIPGTNYAEEHVTAYLTAKPNLAESHVISIDDTDIGNRGKGELLIPILETDGYEILVRGRQTIAIKGPP